LYLGCARSARPLPRGFTGHVAHPIRSILLTSYFLGSPDLLIETRSLPALTRCCPRSFTFYLAPPTRSIPNSSFLLLIALCSLRKLSHQPHRASFEKQVAEEYKKVFLRS
jgi:hypothetical protein